MPERTETQDDFVEVLAKLLNEVIDSGGGPHSLVGEIWCHGDSILKKFGEDLPEDLIVRIDGDHLSLSAMGMLNTALVRMGGEGTDRLIAVMDEDGGLLRFETGPYSVAKKVD